MKQLYTIVQTAFYKNKWSIKKGVLIFLFLSNSSSFTIFSQIFLVYNNGPSDGLYIGGGTGAGTVGAKYQWSNVGMEGAVTIKSIIEIVTIYGGATLSSIDGALNFNDWEPQITGPITTNGNFWGIKFKISYYNATTGLPYNVSKFYFNAIDVDGGGPGSYVREFAIFQTPSSYTVETPTQLSPSFVADGIKFLSGTSQLGPPSTKTQFAISCNYINLNNVTVTCGVYSIGGTSSGFRPHSFSLKSSIGFKNPNTTTTIPLPVELIDFKAQLMRSESVLINWSTASEINNDYFTLERLKDIQTISILSMINGSGSSDHQHNYQYIDNYPLEGISYYRLKQTDYDGKETYSDMISVDNTIQKIEITMITNLFGQKVNEDYRGFVFVIYNNGTTTRTMQ